MKAAGLFAGIGGIELGLHRAGHETVLLSELMPSAMTVLSQRFPDTELIPDVHHVGQLPDDVELLAAGFPCQNLSQAGKGAGITGSQSGLVNEVFRILAMRRPTWLLIENVSFMLQLDRGAAMHHITTELESLGMRWAYRVVDSRSAGVPQRRRRVIFVASATEDPRDVLFADEAGDRVGDYSDDAFGFYWTEGLRGLGWAQDATPTLKGGSTVGIPSPPAIWVRDAEPGRQIVVPGVEDGEALQGFDRGWTAGIEGARSAGHRWKMVGNAVTVGVAEWVGRRLADPGKSQALSIPFEPTGSWPTMAWGENGKRFKVIDMSEFPVHQPWSHLLDVVDVRHAKALSHRGAAGFFSRTQQAKLRFDPDFIVAVKEHVELTRSGGSLVTI